MERREFLKLTSILTAGFLASRVPGYGQLGSDKVFLFTIKNELGNPKIIASRFGITSLTNSNWKYGKYDKDSFQYLETVTDLTKVRDRKKFWFDHYGIPVTHHSQLAFSPESQKGGKNAVETNKEKGNFRVTSSAAGKIHGPILGKHNVESGHLKSICVAGGKAATAKSEWKQISKKGGKAAAIKNVASGQVMIALQAAWKTRIKKVRCKETGKVWNSLRECAEQNELYYPSLKSRIAKSKYCEYEYVQERTTA